MLSIGIGEIQKNSSIFSTMKESFEIIDKRKKIKLAIVYPIKQNSVIDTLSAKYRDKVSNKSLEEIKEISMYEALKDKYDISN
jgi:hypothetical protein